MKYETLPNGKRLPKIGYGTWRIGGKNSADHSVETHPLATLHSALELGYTHFDTAEVYAEGHAEELLGQAIRESGIPREQLFITTKVTSSHLHYDAALQACEHSLRRLGMDYIDLYLIHWPSFVMKLGDAFRAPNLLVRQKKVRFLGVSNFDLNLLKQAQKLSETPLATNQVPYSLWHRSYVKKRCAGILPGKWHFIDGLFASKRPSVKQRRNGSGHCRGPRRYALPGRSGLADSTSQRHQHPHVIRLQAPGR